MFLPPRPGPCPPHPGFCSYGRCSLGSGRWPGRWEMPGALSGGFSQGATEAVGTGPGERPQGYWELGSGP